MEYREMKKLGISPSLLGFGCMRLPTKEGKIDYDASQAMMDKLLAEGVTYIDTAYAYHDGESEVFVGKALKKYDRSKFYLATKLPIWLLEKEGDAERIFAEQLERLQTDYVDFYLLHGMDKNRMDTMENLHLIELLEKFRKEGKIRYIGFSFHDDYDTFEKLIKRYPWDFCQIQYNYMDTHEQAGTKGVELARSLGIPLVIMEPIKGGGLASFADDVKAPLNQVRPGKSVASLALRFVASTPGVNVILSGMSDMSQAEDNLDSINHFQPLSAAEQEAIQNAAEKIRSKVHVGCTACRYCMPCPHGVNIPQNMFMLNDWEMYLSKNSISFLWNMSMKEGERGSACQKCNECVEKCPQHLDIPKYMDEAAQLAGSLGF